jgi:hypothetical protein
MLLFIWILVIGFRTIGQGLRSVDDGSHAQKIIWALGAALFAHAFTFMSVSYFDQIIVAWYLLLAMISAVLDLNTGNRTDVQGTDIRKLALEATG